MKTYTITLNDIKSAADLSPVFGALSSANKEDTVQIFLKENIGGCVYQGADLIKSIEMSKAKVEIVVFGFAASMSANIWIYFYLKRLPRITLSFETRQSYLIVHTPRIVEGTGHKLLQDTPDSTDKEFLTQEILKWGLLFHDFITTNTDFVFTSNIKDVPITNEEALSMFIKNQDILVKDKRLYS